MKSRMTDHFADAGKMIYACRCNNGKIPEQEILFL